MADLNPNRRATLARLASGIFGWQFTSDFVIGGVKVNGCLAEMDESDKLEIAGREILRAQTVACLIKSGNNGGTPVIGLDSAEYGEGDQVTLDGDTKWQIMKWRTSADGAVRTFILINNQ